MNKLTNCNEKITSCGEGSDNVTSSPSPLTATRQIKTISCLIWFKLILKQIKRKYSKNSCQYDNHRA